MRFTVANIELNERRRQDFDCLKTSQSIIFLLTQNSP